MERKAGAGLLYAVVLDSAGAGIGNATPRKPKQCCAFAPTDTDRHERQSGGSCEHLGESRIVQSRIDRKADQVAPLLRPLRHGLRVIRLENRHAASALDRVPPPNDLHALGQRPAGLLETLCAALRFSGAIRYSLTKSMAPLLVRTFPALIGSVTRQANNRRQKIENYSLGRSVGGLRKPFRGRRARARWRAAAAACGKGD